MADSFSVVANEDSSYGGLYAEAGDGQVFLNWDGATYDDIIGYNVYRKKGAGEYSSPMTDFPVKGLSYIDRNVENGVTYYYIVRPVYNSGNISIGSALNEVGATPLYGLTRSIVLQINNPYMNVNGNLCEIDPGRATKPIILNGRTLLPIRAVIEAIGGSVAWDAAERKVTISCYGKTVELRIGSNDISIDGTDMEIDVAPQIINDRTFVPLRAVLENINCRLDWNGQEKKITVKYIDPNAVVSKVTMTTTLIPAETPTATATSGALGIKVDKVDCYAGQTVEVPVRFENVPVDGIDQCSFAIRYDPEVVEIASVSAGSIVKNPSTNFNSNIGLIAGNTVLYYNSDSTESELITTDGVFANVTVKIKESAQTGFAAINPITSGTFVDKNSKNILVSPTGGGINIISLYSFTPTPTAATPTGTLISTPTATPTPTATLTAVSTPTASLISTSTSTFTSTPTPTPTLTATPTPAKTPTPTPTPATVGLEVQMFNANTSQTANSITPRFRIVNNGNSIIELSKVTVKYYYTIDGEKDQSFWCDWSGIGNANVTGRFVKMSTPQTTADYYLEIGFTDAAGTLSPGDTVEVQTRFVKNDWTNYNQSNDYSFNSSASSYVKWDKVDLKIE